MTEGNCEGIGFEFRLTSNALDGVDTTNTTELKTEIIQQSPWCPRCPAHYSVERNPKYRCYPVVLYDQAPNGDYNVTITPTI